MAQEPIDSFALITRRRKEINAKRADLQAALARLDAEEIALKAEEEELAIAERVIGRLSAPPKATDASISAPQETPPPKGSSAAKRVRPKGTPRPEGIPSVPEMVDTLLSEGEKRGQSGLTGRQIVDAIDKRWWPGVSENVIIPTIYRSVSKKQWFKKDRGLFKRLENGAPKRSSAPNGQLSLDGKD